MKNIKTIFAVLVSALFLSGCSLISSSTDGGVFRSDDGGKTFAQKVILTQNNQKGTIGGVDVLSMAVNPQNGDEVYIGTKASGIFKTSDAGENWQQLAVSQLTPQKIYSMAVDKENPAVVYATALVGARAKIIKSEDAGAKWKEIYTEPADGSLVLCLAIDPQNPQNIYAGTDQGQVIYSENGGETWRNLYWSQEKRAIYKIVIDSTNSQLVYFALFQSGMLRTKDGGKNFENLGKSSNFNLQKNLNNPTALMVDPHRTNWVYAGTDSGLMLSKDGGDSWESLRILNKPQEQTIRSITINPQNSDEIIFTVSQALYKSNDGGANWLTVQFNSSRTLDVAIYNWQKPEQVFVGMNSR